jgi:hypothetical protein
MPPQKLGKNFFKKQGVDMRKAIWPMILIALTAFSCTQAPQNPTERAINYAPPEKAINYAPLQEFIPVTSDVSSVKGLHPFDLAFHTHTGRICKTWKWTLAGDTALNNLPECYEILKEIQKDLDLRSKEATKETLEPNLLRE